MRSLLRRLLRALQDIGYGIDAGHAIRRGMATPPRRTDRRAPSALSTVSSGAQGGPGAAQATTGEPETSG